MFEVSKILRDAQPTAYEPKIVSLGPYHYHKPHLRAMNQQHKWSLLSKLLEQDRSKDLKYYLKVIKDNETRARNAYPTQSMIGMCENQFVTMMLLDCVFVIEMLWLWKKSPEGIKNLAFMSDQRSQIIVARDMLLLENQLPFFLIETLFDCAFTGHPGVRGKLKSWLGEFFSGFLDSKISQRELIVISRLRGWDGFRVRLDWRRQESNSGGIRARQMLSCWASLSIKGF
ncbi:UPF0481 protein At3g47200-like [Zingiber officinale]|uniref:UPF0481 protein At3g47200-like n=1 Tax=Zingiber officinale TaxID=94328 RepID=UPI001C4CDE30|nr:UPF0481 protein At3g47200-like [Zingiber officinale]